MSKLDDFGGTVGNEDADLQANTLKLLAEARDFGAIRDLRGLHLSGVMGADGLLLAFSAAGSCLAAAEAAFDPHHRLPTFKCLRKN